MNPLLTILAVIPGIAISLYIIYRDRHEREPVLLLLGCFIAGVVSTLPAIIMEEAWARAGVVESPNMFMTFLLSFVSVATSEEFVKFACVMMFAYPWKYFNEPMDGIVYSVMVSMGFATFENILYADRYGIETVILRAFTAVPAHAAFGIIMGYHIGIAKFKLRGRFMHLLLGLLGAIFFHGTYDFFLLQQNFPPLTIFALFTLAISIFYTRKLLRMHDEGSPFKPPSRL